MVGDLVVVKLEHGMIILLRWKNRGIYRYAVMSFT